MSRSKTTLRVLRRRLRRVTESDDVHRFLVEQAAHGRDHRVEPLDEAAHQRHAAALGAGDECRGWSRGRASPASRRGSACQARAAPARRLRMERRRRGDDRGVALGGGVEILGKGAAQPLGERAYPLGVGVDDDREVGACPDSAMTRAWLAPIAPAPTSAMRARAPIGAVSAGRTSQIVNSQVRFDSAALSQQGEEQRGHHRRGRDARRRAARARREGKAMSRSRSRRRTRSHRRSTPARPGRYPESEIRT